MKNYLLVIIFCISSVHLFAQQVAINNFIVKEHLLKNNKLVVIAVDSAETPLEKVNGTFTFSINGFEQELKFNDGIGVTPQPIGKSTFVYYKHKNDSGTHSKLYYVVKNDNNLNPIKINWMLLVLIPLFIVAVATIFRKFIIFGVIIMILLFYFNSSKGLALPTFFETIIDGLKSLF